MQDNDEKPSEVPEKNEEDKMILTPNIDKETKDKFNEIFADSNFGYDEYSIFLKVREVFQRPPSSIGFVKIISDTKSFMSLSKHNLVDGLDRYEWYSSGIDSPSILLFFPFHLIYLTRIGFKSHYDKHFGKNFLTNFTVYGINDEKSINILAKYDTQKLCSYKESAEYPVRSRDPIRAIRIVSISGKFGLNDLEIYGSAKYDELKTPFPKQFLTTQSIYDEATKDQNVNIVIDKDNPSKKTKKKFSLFQRKKKDDEVEEWEDVDNIRDVRPIKREVDLFQPEMVELPQELDATDPEGPSIIQLLEERYHYLTPLSFNNSYSILSYKLQYIIQPKTFFSFYFTKIAIKLTGIKIKGKMKPKKLRFMCMTGFNEDNFEELETENQQYITPFKTSYFQVNFPKYINMIAILNKNKKIFNLNHVDFYGTVKPISGTYKFTKAPYLFTVYPKFTLENLSIKNINEPGIFETMIKYYGPNLEKFLIIRSRNDSTLQLDAGRSGCILHYNEQKVLTSKNVFFPSIMFLLIRFNIKIKQVKITAADDGSTPEDFYIMGDSIILGKFHYKFKPGETHVFIMNKTAQVTYFFIYGFKESISFKNVDVYGELIKTREDYSRYWPEWHFDTTENMLRQYFFDKYQEDCDNDQKNADCTKILFSAKDYSDPASDIITIGRNKDSKFVTIKDYENNDLPLFDHDENKIVRIDHTTNNEGKSFIYFIFKKAVRPSAIRLCAHNEVSYNFELYGSNLNPDKCHLLLSNTEKDIEAKTSKVYRISECNFYQTIIYVHNISDAVISYISIYGDVKDEKDLNIKPTYSFNNNVTYKNHPSLVGPILLNATYYYGESLSGFVDCNITPWPDGYLKSYFGYCLWNSRPIYMKVCNNDDDHKTAIEFEFLNHVVFINSYSITTSSILNSIDEWKVTGRYLNGYRHILIDKRTKSFKKENHEYTFEIYKEAFQTTPFTSITFRFYNRYTRIHNIEFYGTAIPYSK